MEETNTQHGPKLLNLKEAADQMGVHKMTVYRMVKRGDIPSFRIGKKNIRVSQTDVEDYIQTRRQ